MITPIENNEIGSSVRDKLNQLIELVARGLVFKATDESRVSASMLDDADLLVPVLEDESYLLKFCLVFDPSVSNDLASFTFSVPLLSGDLQLSFVQDVSLTDPEVYYAATGVMPTVTPAFFAGNNVFTGWLRFTTSAAGNVALQWNDDSGAGTATLKAGSWVQLVPAHNLAS